jgi:hypothetical protein
MKPIIWSYGGGKQSVAIGVLIAQGKLPMPERAVIADTGREASSTWRYLEQHMQPLLDSVGLQVEIVPHSYATVDMYNGSGRMVLPAYTAGGEGQLRIMCSNNWKRDVIYRWLREPERGYGPKNPVVQWLGYSLDEIGRCKPSKRKWIEIEWPLLMGYGVTMRRDECVRTILDAGLPEPRKSRCKMCPFMTNAEWAEQKENDPADHLYAIQLDRQIREADKRGGVFVHRSGVPLEQADLSVPDPPQHPLFGQSDSSCNAVGCWT